jgi:hypothetical protein
MGYTNWSDDAYENLKSTRTHSSTNDIFTNNSKRKAASHFLPNAIKFRESRDSDVHPDSLAIAVFLDVTGSMGVIPEILVREKLGSLMNTLIDHGIEHPQILFGAPGDHHCDSFPLQVAQFESGTKELDDSLTQFFLEGGGGGQNRESYLQAWYLCARHTSIDCFEKRGEKGFLFTIGDESNWDKLTRDSLMNRLGFSQASDVTDKQILEEAQKMYHVFHIHINEASYKDDPTVLGYWKKMLGERLIKLDDYNAVAETIASTVALVYGAEESKILASFDSKTASTVKKALENLPKDLVKVDPKKSGVVKL